MSGAITPRHLADAGWVLSSLGWLGIASQAFVTSPLIWAPSFVTLAVGFLAGLLARRRRPADILSWGLGLGIPLVILSQEYSYCVRNRAFLDTKIRSTAPPSADYHRSSGVD